MRVKSIDSYYDLEEVGVWEKENKMEIIVEKMFLANDEMAEQLQKE